jgi:hypothetical protein
MNIDDLSKAVTAIKNDTYETDDTIENRKQAHRRIVKDPRTELLHKMGFEFSHHFVRDDFDGRDGSTHWSVTIGRNGRKGREVTMDYSMGAGHRTYPKHYSIDAKLRGKPIVTNMRRMSIHHHGMNKQTVPNKPTMTDVFYCFLSDANCADGCANYAEFASELGYDEDSIKGDKVYRACQDQNAALNGLVDYREREQLQELFQDY